MANFRQIHVSIWKDPWFLDLEPDEKLLFIYLFSNESTSLAGIYEIAFKVICFETNLSGEFVSKTLEKFEKADKVYYRDGIVWVKNLRKYNSSKSDKVLIRVQNDINEIPDCELKQMYIAYYDANISYTDGIDSLSHEEEESSEELNESEFESEGEYESHAHSAAERREMLDYFFTTTRLPKFRKNADAETFADLLDTYGKQKLAECIDWIAGKDNMTTPKAISSMKTALPNWSIATKNGRAQSKDRLSADEMLAILEANRPDGDE